ncbi:hypothetical protein QBC32DRAFT_214833, partial [Pseudoneurospora amorphoporcata]
SQLSCTSCQHSKPHDSSDLQSFSALGQADAKTLFSTSPHPSLEDKLVSSRFAALCSSPPTNQSQGTELHGYGSKT